jgi:cytochrome subunit of sulfide dehydrogenase
LIDLYLTKDRLMNYLAHRMLRWVVVLTSFAGLGGWGRAYAQAPSPAEFQAQLWAASCMACHGTDGKAEGTGMTIGGRKVEELTGILLAYRSGNRTGTIMQQHTKGYSEDELKRIAAVFASYK